MGRMTAAEKKTFREAFFRKAGRNLRSALAMIDTLPEAAFYVKDADGRFVAANRRNLDVCGIAREEDIIGLTSADIFPAPLAQSYLALDRQVRESGKPVVKTTASPTGDYSTDRLVKSVYPVWAGAECIGTMCVYRQTPARETMPEWHGRLRALTAYIADHCGEPLLVADLAKRAAMSPKVLESVFRLTLGTSVAGFVAAQRLAKARHLLETTDKTIAAIAAECGYCDHSHFTKAFRHRWGRPPGTYRTSLR